MTHGTISARFTMPPELAGFLTPGAAMCWYRSDDQCDVDLSCYIDGDERHAFACFTWNEESGASLTDLVIDCGALILSRAGAAELIGWDAVEQLRRDSTEAMLQARGGGYDIAWIGVRG
jgi:hypothetical protein